MFKHATFTRLVAVLGLVVLVGQGVRGQSVVQPVTDGLDTIGNSTRATRMINQRFDEIYLQNARVATFGNEYGHPVPTQLVADLTGNFVLFSTPKSRFGFIFNPRVKLRLLSTQGAPVKSPSYMPGGTLYYRLNRDYNRASFLSLAYSHHSNGVRGPTLNANDTFNTDSGKFTTNFYTIAYTNGHRQYHDKLISDRYETLGLELHAALIGQGYTPPLKDKYGFVRLNGSWMYNLSRARPDDIDPKSKVYDNWMRLHIEFMYILDTYANYSLTNVQKRLNISAMYYYQLPFMQNMALMLGGGYRGQDDYNMSFQDSYGYLSVGVAAGVSFGFKHK
ncbi:hypothetical protein KXQ82_10870 [Mucilaginibacter sp. HMF5004]|uniref:hypothetical protein n=1 Tax=Mucilaginibacter rivuli TaxID=2857527 RepID=UPI001C5D78AE|nr:hypothetical protein [Mucilaginibacter rivuli]MBW4890223.1 hypothetical protein [Mucilaginibacter rivuli]